MLVLAVPPELIEFLRALFHGWHAGLTGLALIVFAVICAMIFSD